MHSLPLSTAGARPGARTGGTAHSEDMNAAPEHLAPELISAVPHLLTYQPTESLVLVSYDYDCGRISFGPTLRIDFGFEAVAAATETDLLEPVCALARVSAAQYVIPVLFSADMDGAARARWADDLLDNVFDHYAVPLKLIGEALECTGFTAHSAWWVSHLGYGSFTAGMRSGTVCELDRTQSFRQLSRANGDPFASFSAATALPECDLALESVITGTRGQAHERDELFEAWLAEVLRYAELIESGQQHSLNALPAPDPKAVLGLEALCQEKWGRDAVLMLVSFEHSAFLPEDMRRLEPGEFAAYAEAVAPLAEATADLPGLSSRRPNARASAYGILLLKMMATYVRMEHLPAVLSMIAWMEWSIGRASFALCFARNALTIDSTCTLARLVSRAVMTPTLPLWAHEPVPEQTIEDGAPALRSGSAPVAALPSRKELEPQELSFEPQELSFDRNDPPVLEG